MSLCVLLLSDIVVLIVQVIAGQIGSLTGTDIAKLVLTFLWFVWKTYKFIMVYMCLHLVLFILLNEIV